MSTNQAVMSWPVRSEAAKVTALLPEDLLRFRMLGDLHLSPDGSLATFVVFRSDLDANENVTDVWLAPTRGFPRPAQLLPGWGRTSRPQFSPDGRRLAFLADPDGSESFSLWAVDVTGGSPKRVVTLRGAVSDFAWSPDSRQVALVGREADQTELWVCQIDGDNLRLLNADLYSHSEPAWTPDGRIAFLARVGDDQPALWIIDSDGGEPHRLTRPGFSIDSFAFSREGRLAVVQPDLPGRADGHHRRLYVDDRCLTGSIDRSIAADVTNDSLPSPDLPRLRWSSDGDRLYFRMADRGCIHLYCSTLEQEDLSMVIGGQQVVSDFDVAGDRVVYLASSLELPPAIWTVRFEDDAPSLLFDPNPWLGERTRGRAVPLVFEWQSHSVDGWAMLPPKGATSRRPAVLHVHGGPHSAYGHVFTLLFQLLVGAGYTVIFCNPPGSTTYDEAYSLSLHGAWGELDSKCLMAFVTHALGQGLIGEDNLGIAGTSYGGYPVLWTIARDNRFRAALVMRGISDRASVDTAAGEGFARSVQSSQSLSLTEIRTPLLLIASGDDQRVPPEQSRHVYEHLRQLGREVDLVVFPGEGHSIAVLGRPVSRVEHALTILNWWAKHLQV